MLEQVLAVHRVDYIVFYTRNGTRGGNNFVLHFRVLLHTYYYNSVGIECPGQCTLLVRK